MKITFFKEEDYFNPRISSVCENTKSINAESKPEVMQRVSVAAITVNLIFMTIALIKQPKHFLLLYILTYCMLPILILPIHELCHVLGARLIKKPVLGIRFFPNQFCLFKNNRPGTAAYVKLDFCASTKAERILFIAAPLIILSFIPIMFAFLIPEFRTILLSKAFINIGTSAHDITNILELRTLPKFAVYLAWRQIPKVIRM